MAANDETDFRTEFKVLTDSNEELVRISIQQRKIILLFCSCFLLVSVLLLTVSSVSLKEFVDIVKALRDFGYHGNLVDLDSFEK